jgi:hypothetical protein
MEGAAMSTNRMNRRKLVVALGATSLTSSLFVACGGGGGTPVESETPAPTSQDPESLQFHFARLESPLFLESQRAYSISCGDADVNFLADLSGGVQLYPKCKRDLKI